MGLVLQIALGIILAPVLVILLAFVLALVLAAYDGLKTALDFALFVFRHALMPGRRASK